MDMSYRATCKVLSTISSLLRMHTKLLMGCDCWVGGFFERSSCHDIYYSLIKMGLKVTVLDRKLSAKDSTDK